MTPELAALLAEWFTGRDGERESARFASRWVDSRAGGFASRVYTPHLGDLDAAVRAQSTAYRTGVAITIGADGQDDIRIETQEAGTVPAPVLYETQVHVDGTMAMVSDPRTINPTDLGKKDVERWRPASGSLGRVVGHDGAPHKTRPKLAAVATKADAVAVDALAADTREDLHAKATLLRTHRALLREKRDAMVDAEMDVTTLDAELDAVTQKLAPIAVEAEARKVASRQERANMPPPLSNEEKAALRDAEVKS